MQMWHARQLWPGVACHRCQTGAAGAGARARGGSGNLRLGKSQRSSTLTHIDMDMAKPMNMYKNIRMQWLDGCCLLPAGCSQMGNGKWEMHIYVLHTYKHIERARTWSAFYDTTPGQAGPGKDSVSYFVVSTVAAVTGRSPF